MTKNGFTLLELVVAIALVAILLSASLPSLWSQGDYTRRLAAELKLLSWQASGDRPSNDTHYTFHKTTRDGIAHWSARSSDSTSKCRELMLRRQTKEPTACWPAA